jgi:hypothetical protein
MANSIRFFMVTRPAPKTTRQRLAIGAMTAVPYQATTITLGVTGKSVHAAMNSFSAAIADRTIQKNEPSKLTAKEVEENQCRMNNNL